MLRILRGFQRIISIVLVVLEDIGWYLGKIDIQIEAGIYNTPVLFVFTL